MLLTFARTSDPSFEAIGYSGERVKNLFIRPTRGVSQGVLIGRSGADRFASLDPGEPVRAIENLEGNIYAVVGGGVWRIENGVSTLLGEVIDSRETFTASNGSEIAIVAGGKYYICDGTTVTEYSTGAVDVPRGVTFQDGYFVVIGEAFGRGDGMTVSGLDDGTTFDELEFAFAENSPDDLRAVLSDHGELWLFGPRTIEIWWNTGGADFPFARNTGAVIEKGCLAGKTVAKEDNMVYWVGADRIVYRSAGASPEVISTREVEEQLDDADIELAFTFKDRGHKFYAIRLSNQADLVFDLTTGAWHERTTGIGENPWLITCATIASGVEYFGTDSGRIVTLNPETFQDDGEIIEAEAISAPVESQGDFFSINRIHMNIRGGVGGIGRQPQVMLQTTKDGRNWSDEKWRDLGDVGQYYLRAVWHALGMFRRFQVRVRITDAVPRDIYGVHYE